jgi:hypothetical protein
MLTSECVSANATGVLLDGASRPLHAFAELLLCAVCQWLHWSKHAGRIDVTQEIVVDQTTARMPALPET